MKTTQYTFILLAAMAMTCSTVTACRDKTAPPARVTMTCAPGMHRAAGQDICISGSCGNSNVDPGEVCDDGNRIAGDGCSTDCGSVEACGNGVVDQTVGEVCDDGNETSGDACCGDCRSCPELAVHHITKPSHGSLPDTQPCPDTTAKIPGLPDVTTPSMEPKVMPTRLLAPRPQLQSSPALDQALARVADLERMNATLQQSLATERRELAALLERIARGRTDELH